MKVECTPSDMLVTLSFGQVSPNLLNFFASVYFLFWSHSPTGSKVQFLGNFRKNLGLLGKESCFGEALYSIRFRLVNGKVSSWHI